MATRSILGLQYLLRALRDIGECPEPVLARYGMDMDKMDPSAHIDRHMELRLYSEITETLKNPLAGLLTGTYFGFAGYGPFTMLLMTCQSAYEALQAGIRYQQLTFLFGQLRFEPGDELSALVLTPLQLPPKVYRFRVDGEISGTYKLVRDMQITLGVDLRPERIEIPYDRPLDFDAYEKYFGVPVQFGSKEARFWIRNEYLQLRLPTADPTAHALFRTQCDQLLIELTRDYSGLTDKVRSHLDLFSHEFPSAAEVAAALGMTERTLRRQLSQESSSFRSILDEIRFQKARRLLLSTDQPVEQIARSLGYAESAAFIHAFQRWAHCTPAAMRRQVRHPPTPLGNPT